MTKRVLIVDDSMLIRRMLADCLIDDGWEVAGEAADGQEAVDQYEQLRPDAVTLDIVMPGADGMYALAKIQQFDPDARVVVVSALSQTKIISQAIRHGACDFIVKPFLPEQVQETLRSAMGEPVEV